MAEFKLEETTGEEHPKDEDRLTRKYEAIPDDSVFEAKVTKIEVRPHPFFKDDEGNPEIKVNFQFTFDDGEGKRILFGETPTTFTTHPDCKLRNWVQQILGGIEVPAGYNLNTDTLVDSPVRIVVGLRTWKDRDTNEDKWRNSVKDVMYAKTLASVPNTGSAYVEEPF
jgi:hypothetical protein